MKDKILNNLVGFRTRNKRNMIIGGAYYLFSLILSISMGKMFLFSLVTMFAIPLMLAAVLDSFKNKNPKQLLIIPICLVLIIICAIITPGSNLPKEVSLTVENIDFEDINQSQDIEFAVIPSDADTTTVQLISENPDIASFSGNTLSSISEGETTIYAMVAGTDIKSQAVTVSVTDKQAEIERKAQAIIEQINKIQTVTLDSKQAIEEAEAAYNSADDSVKEKITNASTLTDAKSNYARLEAEEQRKQEEAAKKAQQEQEAAEKAKQEAAKKAAAQASQNNNSGTVYIGATGNKYHTKSCRTLKGKGTAISIEKAKAQGRTACKVCGG